MAKKQPQTPSLSGQRKKVAKFEDETRTQVVPGDDEQVTLGSEEVEDSAPPQDSGAQTRDKSGVSEKDESPPKDAPGVKDAREEATAEPEPREASLANSGSGQDSKNPERLFAPRGETGQPPVNRTPQLQKPDTAGSRLRTWLGGTTAAGKPVAIQENAVTIATAAAAPREEGPLLTPASARKELRALKSSRRSQTTVVKNAEENAQKVQEEITANDKSVAAINDWVGRFDRSFQWKLQQALDRQLTQAKRDLTAYEASAKNVQEFEPGRLVQLRKRFHRSAGIFFFLSLPLALLVVLLPILFRIPKLDALETFYDPRLSAPIIILTVVAVIGTVLLVRRGLGKDTVKNSTIVKWVAAAVLIGLVILVLPALQEMIRQVVIPFLEQHRVAILLAIVAAVTLWTVISLAVYHQGWSTYRRGVATQLAKLVAVIDGYVESRQEVHRLELLHEQTNEWLRILAHALYRPWATDPEWEFGRPKGSQFQDFPFALRVAEVEDPVGAKSAELERIIASKLLVQGWRADAFKDLVTQVGVERGLAADAFSVASLDKDLPHQTNNTRNVMRTTLEDAANVTGEGGDAPPKSRFLIEVARSRLLELIEQTQSVALSAARPNVRQIVFDPLEHVALDSGTVTDGDQSQNWDGFLKESLGAEEIAQPPLSILNFTPEGQMEKVGETPTTYILIPQRLAGALPEEGYQGIQMVPVSDNSSRPVEIIARIDVAGSMEGSRIRLLTKTERLPRESGPGATGAMPGQNLCRTCFDPTCPASVDAAKSCVNADW